MYHIDNRTRLSALLKVASYGSFGIDSGTVGSYSPGPTVSDVLNAIGVAQANDIGTQEQRTDAFGKIINSGLTDSSPAYKALKMVGGGILGHTVAKMVTDKPFYQGLGAGFGILAGSGNLFGKN